MTKISYPIIMVTFKETGMGFRILHNELEHAVYSAWYIQNGYITIEFKTLEGLYNEKMEKFCKTLR